MTFCNFKVLISDLKVLLAPFRIQGADFPDWELLAVFIPVLNIIQQSQKVHLSQAARPVFRFIKAIFLCLYFCDTRQVSLDI